MDLGSVMNQAWDFLEKSMKDKKAVADAEGKRLTNIEAEREKTKRMNISSQEKLQLMINSGVIEKQELVNQGIMTQQQMKNSGLMDVQEASGQNQLALQDKRNIGSLETQTQKDVGALDRTKLVTKSNQVVAKTQGKSAMDNNWKTVKEYNTAGDPASERLVNPNRQMPVMEEYEEDADGSQVENLLGNNPQSSISQPNPGITPLSDITMSSGRHTAGRTMGLTRDPLERKKKDLYNRFNTRRMIS